MLPSHFQLIIWGLLSIIIGFLMLIGIPIMLSIALILTWLTLLILTAYRFNKKALPLSVKREAAKVAAVGQPYQMILSIHSHAPTPLKLSLYDHFPDSFHSQEMPITLNLQPKEQAKITYTLIPEQRGDAQFYGIQIQYNQGLWRHNRIIPCIHDLRVYPLFQHQSHIPLLHQNFIQNSPISTTLSHHHGQEEFSHLRDYQMGDNLKHLDYKASARLNKLISKSYQHCPEQPLIIALDSSRRMHGEALEQALDAAMLLIQTALKQGDAVGFISFSARLKQYLPIARGTTQYARMMNTAINLQADDTPPDYLNFARQFYYYEKKTCLLILITTLESQDSQNLKAAIRLLKHRYKLILISLCPPYLDTPLPIHRSEQAAQVAARDDYANHFESAQKILRAEKINFISCQARALKIPLINAYLQSKRPL